MKRNSQSGVALVITLILLSVITFMAVTFLVVSRREAGQVNTLTQQSNAKFATEDALEHVKAQVIANMLTSSNGYNFGLLVSTNFVTTNFVNSGNFETNLLNVCYTNGITSASDLQFMLNNLLILPRAPVFIRTNSAFPNNLDFRYYLDLNRNGTDDVSGFLQVLDNTGRPIPNPSGGFLSNYYIGDPEWIGVLNYPDRRHSSSNLFIARYCYFAVPIGNSLDINYIHNQAKELSLTGDGFLRDQGVGSWEINLAAFLCTLNTDTWSNSYNYSTNLLFPSAGFGFQDAQSILQYRYATNQLPTLLQTIPNGAIFGNDFIDEFSRGPLMTSLVGLTNDSGDISGIRAPLPWSGANNPNKFFTPGDLFTKVPYPALLPASSFSNRLYQAGFSPGTEDRYTFYRLLSQMSFDSSPEPSPYPFTNKINLNYNNISFNATNLVSWTNNPLQFFTNAADRMLRRTFPNPILTVVGTITNTNFITITNIPIYPANIYTPAIHRIIQLAANIYDAGNTNYYPSVFRPTFGVSNSYIYINGYTTNESLVADYSQIPIALPEQASLVTSSTTNIFGIPWIFGAKKGFPNFNRFSLSSASQVQRKIQITRTNSITVTNIQYTVGISNALVAVLWNSYAAAYTNPITVTVYNFTPLTLTNEFGLVYATNAAAVLYITNYNSLTGFNSTSTSSNVIAQSFQYPLFTNQITLADSVYYQNPSPNFVAQTATSPVLFYPNQPALPHFAFNMTNRFRIVVTDSTGHLIDYVSFATNIYRDLTGELPGPLQGTVYNTDPGGMWQSNMYGIGAGAVPLGAVHQIQLSMGQGNSAGSSYPNITTNDWQNDGLVSTIPGAIANFQTFMAQSALAGATNGAVQVPFSPIRKVIKYFTLQANDPLVHYTVTDLQGTLITNTFTSYLSNFTTLPGLGAVNTNYYPWSDAGKLGVGTVGDKYGPKDLSMRDPGASSSDAWQFPTNKFPNIGWLGRVHRGTPWQTVYLKSAPIATNAVWAAWTGNPYTSYNNYDDSITSQPINDWALMDLFTTSPNENASRGQLSVNQTGLAAWSAILDGVITVSNNVSVGFVPMVIDPTNICTPPGLSYTTNTVQYLVNSINAFRASTNFGLNGTFSSVGQICAVPQLTVNSPYLDTSATGASILTDAAYERIPQQILSLLRLGSPRYVVFAYGQSLKPANASIVTSGSFFGMCTNYQITGEMATRTVVRFDNFPGPNQSTAPRTVVESFNVLAPE